MGMLMLNFVVKVFWALAIGGLIGLEREHAFPKGAIGLRSFALTALLGTMLSELSDEFFLLPVIGLLGITAMAALFYFYRARQEGMYGITTVLMLPFAYGLGIMISLGRTTEAAFLSIVLVALLVEYRKVHSIVKKVTKQEIIDALIFVILAFVIYPMIPLEPVMFLGQSIQIQFFWVVVVLVSLVSFAAHLLVKFLHEKGAVYAAFLGGIISSLATVTYFLKKVKKEDFEGIRVILFFSTAGAIFADIIILAVINPAFLLSVSPILGTTLFVFLFFAFYYKKQIALKGVLFSSKPISLEFTFEFAAIFFIVTILIESAVSYGLFGLFSSAILGGLVSTTSVLANLSLLSASEGFMRQDLVIASLLAILSSQAVKCGLIFYKIGTKNARKLFPVLLAALLALFVYWLAYII
ncbi:MgtC/SapB family protein [Candidatus Micrarchaeota archaeon]|nr:MgtC/SapB family protein [Candidatus Micrarchaeota archaeon]